jgi:FixJ family two-component response regulator
MRIAGYTNQCMADKLGIAKRTVEVHVQVITEKATAWGYEWRFALYKTTDIQKQPEQ